VQLCGDEDGHVRASSSKDHANSKNGQAAPVAVFDAQFQSTVKE